MTRLTDGKGRKGGFPQRPSDHDQQRRLGGAVRTGRQESRAAAHKEAMNALRATFRPEFLNRIDDIVLFNPLGRAQLDKIVDLQLSRCAQDAGRAQA